MTAETLAGLLGSLLALLFAYVPGFQDWFNALTGVYKRLAMAIGLIIVAAAVFGLSCAGLAAKFGWQLTCDVTGAIGFIQVLIAALVANQGAYLLLVRKSAK
jgi:hypothetical protein